MKLSIQAILMSVLVASCTSESTDFQYTDEQPYSDATSEGVRGLLQTATQATNAGNSWFCTLTEEGQFLSRSQWYLWADGGAVVDGLESTWTYENSQLTMQQDLQSTVYSDIGFSERLYYADKFTATADDGKLLNCDWSGPPRDGQAFSDGSDSTNIEEIARETIDVLLTSGRAGSEQASYWICQDMERTDTAFLMHLLDDGSNLTTMQGRWSRVDSSTLDLDIDGFTEQWREIEISEYNNDLYGRFTAVRADESSVECLFSGEPRSSAWKEG